MAKNLLDESGLEHHFRNIAAGDVPQTVNFLSPSERAQLSELIDDSEDDNAIAYALGSTRDVAAAVRNYWAA